MKLLGWAGAMALGAMSLLPETVQATAAQASHANNQNYSFRLIIDTKTSQFSGFLSPALNNRGEVAFDAGFTREDGQATGGVFASDGTTLRTIFTTPEAPGVPSDLAGQPSINDAGVVAFRSIINGVAGIYASKNGVIDLLAPGDFDPVFLDINNQSEATFTSRDRQTILVGRAGSSREVGSGIVSAINDPGTVAFYNGSQILTETKGVITPVVDATLPLFFVSINNAGTIAFPGTIGGSDRLGVYKVVNGEVETVADNSGPFSDFGAVSINNRGTVAFQTNLRQNDNAGIFTGPDPVQDKVVAFGDTLFGAQVLNLQLARESLNDKGDIVFVADLSDGRSAIIVASPRHGHGKHAGALHPREDAVLKSPF